MVDFPNGKRNVTRERSEPKNVMHDVLLFIRNANIKRMSQRLKSIMPGKYEKILLSNM